MSAGYIAYWLIVANLIGFLLMIWDKSKAETGEWRIAESTLLLWSLIGGSLGTLAASRIVRHKTRKQPIANLLVLIPAAQVLLFAAAVNGLLDPVIGMATDLLNDGLETLRQHP